MVLGFKTEVNGKPTYFPEKILSCVGIVYINEYVPKKHTMRHGKRWRAGMKLHLSIGVRTKNYLQFNKNIKGLEVCKSVQDIKIDYSETYLGEPKIYVDNRQLVHTEIVKLAINDGFESLEDFLKWFNTDFEGQIIHWTDLKY